MNQNPPPQMNQIPRHKYDAGMEIAVEIGRIVGLAMFKGAVFKKCVETEIASLSI